MGTGRKFNKAPMTRPTKSEAARKRRQKTHAKRLVALGVDEAVVAKMDVQTIRTLLRRPNKVKASV